MSEPRFEEFFIYDVHPEYTLEARAEKAEAEKIYFTEVKPRLEKRAKTYQTKFDRLYDDAETQGIRVNNLFLDIEFKREALKNILGYKSLKGFSSIDEASDQAVANVYKKVYYSSEQARRQSISNNSI